MTLLSVLSDLMEAIEAAPRFAFREDLAACRSISHFATDEQLAAKIGTLIEGCRATSGFPFGADVDEAERALLKFGFAIAGVDPAHDPDGKVGTRLAPDVEGDAVFLDRRP